MTPAGANLLSPIALFVQVQQLSSEVRGAERSGGTGLHY